MSDRIQVIEENARPYINGVFVDYLGLPDRELKVFLALKSFAWNQKSDCYPSLAAIGKICNKGRRQVIEILHALEKRGIIRVDTSPGYANTYYITNKYLETSEEKLPTTKSAPVRKSAPLPCGNPHPSRAEIRTRSNISNNTKQTEKRSRKKRALISDSFYPSPENQKLADRRASELGCTGAWLIKRFIEVQKEYKTMSDDFDKNFKDFLTKQKPSKRQGMSYDEKPIRTSTERHTESSGDYSRRGGLFQATQFILQR